MGEWLGLTSISYTIHARGSFPTISFRLLYLAMFTADTFLSFLDILVNTIGTFTFINIYSTIYYSFSYTSSSPSPSSSDIHLSTIISIITTILHLFIFLLWVHITLHYTNDILNYRAAVIAWVGNTKRSRMVVAGTTRRLL